MAKPTIDEVRHAAEQDLVFFARLVGPERVYGKIHEDLFRWLANEEGADNKLCLMPRDHLKSHCMAVLIAWTLTRQPWQTIMYVSATADLAEKQLYAIKNILESDIYQRYWPEMINPEEGKRAKWSVSEIVVDHPLRKRETVRDPSIKAIGLSGNKTGFHCGILALDDIVVPENAYTEEGRRKVEAAYSQLASIKSTGAKTYVVGTRYHPRDIYDKMQSIEVERYEDGVVVDKTLLYDIFLKVVEKEGDFLWPRTQREDGRYFGFDHNELAKKRAEYMDKAQFYAQYYNNPNDPTGNKISSNLFQYYDKKHLKNINGSWFVWQGREDLKLNVVASIDFAYTIGKKSDYTAIVVVGMDCNRNIYVLDISRFQSNSINSYFEEIRRLWMAWGFKKLRAEATGAQKNIINELRTNYFPKNGVSLSLEEHYPTRHQGTKEERIDATLLPKYEGMSVYHYRSGNIQLLEEELMLAHPPHDDIKDALASAVDAASPALNRSSGKRKKDRVVYHPRFGGVSR